MGCTAIAPIVDGIEREFQGELKVIRVNIQEPEGRSLAETYGFEYTPTFIFFNAAGEEVWRSVGEISDGKVRRSLP